MFPCKNAFSLSLPLSLSPSPSRPPGRIRRWPCWSCCSGRTTAPTSPSTMHWSRRRTMIWPICSMPTCPARYLRPMRAPLIAAHLSVGVPGVEMCVLSVPWESFSVGENNIPWSGFLSHVNSSIHHEINIFFTIIYIYVLCIYIYMYVLVY